jgi:mannose-1-phosphate guanylyltransferase
MIIPVPPAKAVLVNPEALPVVELAVLLVVDEVAVLLDLLLEPQAVNTAPAITAAATRPAVDARARCGAFKRDGFIVRSGLADASGK